LNIFKRKRKIGIALSGGAARALSHIGVLEVLEELDIKPMAIAGTSMGAVIGSFYCIGITLEEMESYVRSMNWKSFLLFSDLALSSTGIINGRRIEDLLRKFLGNKTFSDCKIPFCCVAVDLVKRAKVVLSEGKLLDAVRASISIPGFFSAVYLDNQILVDGGVVEPLPTESIKTMDVNFIIASSIVFQKDREKYMQFLYDNNSCQKANRKDFLNDPENRAKSRKSRILKIKKAVELKRQIPEKLSVNKVLDTSFSIMHYELIKNYLKNADIVIEPEVGDFGFFDLIRGGQIIQRGVEATRKKIPEIKRKLHL